MARRRRLVAGQEIQLGCRRGSRQPSQDTSRDPTSRRALAAAAGRRVPVPAPRRPSERRGDYHAGGRRAMAARRFAAARRAATGSAATGSAAARLTARTTAAVVATEQILEELEHRAAIKLVALRLAALRRTAGRTARLAQQGAQQGLAQQPVVQPQTGSGQQHFGPQVLHWHDPQVLHPQSPQPSRRSRISPAKPALHKATLTNSAPRTELAFITDHSFQETGYFVSRPCGHNQDWRPPSPPLLVFFAPLHFSATLGSTATRSIVTINFGAV